MTQIILHNAFSFYQEGLLDSQWLKPDLQELRMPETLS